MCLYCIPGGWAIPGDDGEFIEKAYSVFLFAFMHNIPVGCLCFFYGSVIRKMVKMAADKQASECHCLTKVLGTNQTKNCILSQRELRLNCLTNRHVHSTRLSLYILSGGML